MQKHTNNQIGLLGRVCANTPRLHTLSVHMMGDRWPMNIGRMIDSCAASTRVLSLRYRVEDRVKIKYVREVVAGFPRLTGLGLLVPRHVVCVENTESILQQIFNELASASKLNYLMLLFDHSALDGAENWIPIASQIGTALRAVKLEVKTLSTVPSPEGLCRSANTGGRQALLSGQRWSSKMHSRQIAEKDASLTHSRW
ncbi:hypothetical protein BCR34DRAFT_326952 [Clohesyomyces aquaticus]|uniref:Uncharacterized protein n=1 Tax=Clohesyomyces aquaticus TaxID=1231657 RepID=A0A1Y1ZMJ5_9PLEO|nr:hypothetical protein BCR34DRAFT_326952 [Clohesyomyces aquaticus]